MKLVINRCYGGFGLSEEAVVAYAVRKGKELWIKERNSLVTEYWTVPPEERPPDLSDRWGTLPMEERIANNREYAEKTISVGDIPRDDPDLVAVVEELGERAAGKYSNPEVVEIPDGVEWEIQEYDGSEWVAEKHRTWP